MADIPRAATSPDAVLSYFAHYGANERFDHAGHAEKIEALIEKKARQ